MSRSTLALVTHPVPAELTVTSITTAPATAVEYQKNGGATWIPGAPLGSSVAVGSFPGFTPGDYVSGLRFRLTAVAVGFDTSQLSKVKLAHGASEEKGLWRQRSGAAWALCAWRRTLCWGSSRARRI